MEMGGSNSHGAVVAREYGIPAVVGVPDATHRMRTGQLVTVDGASGLVQPASDRMTLRQRTGPSDGHALAADPDNRYTCDSEIFIRSERCTMEAEAAQS